MWPWFSSDLQDLIALDDLQLIDLQLAVSGQIDCVVRQWARRRAFDLPAARLKFATVAGTGDRVRFRFPLRDTAKMRAHRRDRIKSSWSADDIYLLVLQEGDRVHRVEIRIARAKRCRRLEQHVRGKILI